MINMEYLPFKSWLKVIALGLVILIGITVALCLNWYQTTQRHDVTIRALSTLQLKRQLILNLHNVIHNRAGSLSRLATMTDDFSFDDEYLLFTSFSSHFVNSKHLLLQYHIADNKERREWEKVFAATKVLSKSAYTTIERLINSAPKTARRHYLTNYMPSLEALAKLFSDRIRGVTQQEKKLINKIVLYEDTVNQLVVYIIMVFTSLGVVTFTLLILFMRLYFKSATAVSTRIGNLADLFSQQELSSEEQIERLLEYGCFLLNMDTGALSKLSQDSSTALLLNYYSTSNNVAPGNTVSTDRTFCSAIHSNEVEIVSINLPYIKNSSKPLLHNNSKFTSYMACKIYQNGSIFGVLYFSNSTQHQDFTPTMKNVLRLISGWISYILANKYYSEELRQSRLDANNANTLKNSFLCNISHELRTPLNAIIGYSDLLVDELAGDKNKTSGNDAKRISESGNHLLSLINEILDLSYIEADKFDLHSDYFNFNRIFEQITESVNLEMEKNQNTLAFDKSDANIILYTDKSRLIQVLTTILTIASQFNQKSEIHLGAKTLHRSGKDWLEVKITDFGIKMSDDQISRIFKPFTQADSSFDRVYGGTGLELTISKRICQLMGGDIHVEKDSQSNTVFIVMIPSNVISQNYADYSKTG